MRRLIGFIVALWLTVPVAAPAQRAGTLIDAQPVVDTPAGAQAWRIRYWSTGDRGRPIEVTGMVVAPREAVPPRPRPVIAWTHGTWGITPVCAPSESPNFFKSTVAVDAVKRGYVVVAPDYEGLGSAGPHGFLVGEAAARNTLDAVRAARGIPGAAAGSRFAVWGESQGGHSALWTGLSTRSYAPDLSLAGVAAIVPPTDLVRNLREAKDQTVRAFFMAYVIKSWSDYYRVPITSVARPGTANIIRRLADKCIVLDSKPKLLTIIGILTLKRDLRTVDLGTRQPWARYARANSVPVRSPGAPLLIATSDGDALVNSAVVRSYVDRMCAARQGPVRYIHLMKDDHVATTRTTAAETMDWIDARFAGRPARNDCNRI